MTTINILGDTPKQQWLNAIGICNMAIESNLVTAENAVTSGDEDMAIETIETAKRVLADYTAEMRRLVNAVFKEN